MVTEWKIINLFAYLQLDVFFFPKFDWCLKEYWMDLHLWKGGFNYHGNRKDLIISNELEVIIIIYFCAVFLSVNLMLHFF